MIDKYDNMNDELLIKLAIQEDKQAFDAIIKRYQVKVAGLISRYIWDSEEVADMTQEIFIRAYCALEQFRGDSCFSTWLYRITINYLKNTLVMQKRKISTLSVSLDYLEQMLGMTFLKDQDSPEQMLLLEQSQGIINEMMSHLGDEVKMAFILRELEGLSYEDIADILECPIGTVRSRIFRARESLEVALHEILQAD